MVLGEEGWRRLSAETDGAVMLSSVLLIMEARRNLTRFARRGTLTAEQYRVYVGRVERDVEQFVLREVTLDLCDVGPLPPVATPRSLDLVHLRTALRFNTEQRIDRFVTLDVAQEQAARELGLPV